MRKPLLPLDQQLLERPYEFSFFQAVRLLSLIDPSRAPVGGGDRLGDEARLDQEGVRFKVHQSLEFPASELYSVDPPPDTNSAPIRMFVRFMGLTGFQGVLPLHYTEHILARALAKDFTMAEFFDLFNHRLISLFYRAWEKHHVAVLFQSATARSKSLNKKEPDRITEYLLDLIGMGTPGLRGRLSESEEGQSVKGMPDEGLLRYAGLFVQAPHSASALRGILSDYFGVSVEIEQLLGAWHRLADDDRCNLLDADIRNDLGGGAIAGDAVWDSQTRFRVRLGPLTFERFSSFLPDSQTVREMIDLTRLFVGDVLDFDWQPVLLAAEVPWCILGDESPSGSKLGWSTWLKTEEFGADVGDVVFTPVEAV